MLARMNGEKKVKAAAPKNTDGRMRSLERAGSLGSLPHSGHGSVRLASSYLQLRHRLKRPFSRRTTRRLAVPMML